MARARHHAGSARRWRHSARPRRQPLVRWLEYFERVLNLAQWPGEAPLAADSLRVQRAWGEVCDRLQRLDGVLVRRIEQDVADVEQEQLQLRRTRDAAPQVLDEHDLRLAVTAAESVHP